MNAKKIVSTLTVFAMLTALPATVLARPVTTHQTVAKLDLSTYSVGDKVTSEQLASLGLDISSKSDDGQLPDITVQSPTYTTYIGEKVLCFEITNKTPFTLSAALSVPDTADKVDAEFFYKLADECTDNNSKEKRIDFEYMGTVYAGEDTIIRPALHKDGYMNFYTHDVKAGWNCCYNQWNNATYSLDYSKKTLSYDDKTSHNDGLEFEHWLGFENEPLTVSAMPDKITWEPGDVSALPDEVSVKLYIGGFSVTTETQKIPSDTVSSSETTFFDGAGVNGAAVNPASMMNNVFKVTGEWGVTTAQNSTELPANADSLGFQFCGLNVPDGPAKLIIARYTLTDDNFKKLSDVSVNDVTITDGKAVSNTSLDLTKDTADGTLVQAYLWDTLKNITPLSAYGSAEIGESGTKIYSLSFEDEHHEDISGATGYLSPVDNSESKLTIVSDEDARYGSQALKVECLASSDFSGSTNRNGFRLGMGTAESTTNLSKEAAAGIGKDNKYRISFYAKASDADAVINSSLWTESSTYRWNSYSLFKDVTVKSGDWQYFVVYTNLPDCTLYGKKWSEIFNECPYEVLNFDVTTDVHQSVYFDNILIEKLDTASTAE